MPAEEQLHASEEIKSVATVDEENGTITQTVGPSDGFEIKSEAGTERSYVEGYVATKGVDKKGELFTEEALKSIADQINDSSEEIETDLDTMDVVFPDPEDVETATGNIEHQSSPALEKKMPALADTRTVPAFEFADAEYDGFGTKVKAYIRENALPEQTVEAIKNNIKSGVLNAFSIEFKTLKDKYERIDGKVRRVLQEVKATGAAATAVPVQENAQFTDFELKSVLADSETVIGEDLREELKNEVRDEIEDELREEIKEEVKNDINGESTVTEEEQTEEQVKSEAGDSEEHSLADDVEELKSVVNEVKETNEELKSEKERLEEENEELKSRLEDFEEIEEMKSNVEETLDDLKEELKSAEPEDQPVSDDSEERMEETKSEPSMLEKEVQARDPEKVEEIKSVLAEKYNTTEEEVMKHVE